MTGVSDELIRIPEGAFSYPRCLDDNCEHCHRQDRDINGRYYCGWYGSYFHQYERDGCLSFRHRIDWKCAECIYANLHDRDRLGLVWCEYWERYVLYGCIAGYQER